MAAKGGDISKGGTMVAKWCFITSGALTQSLSDGLFMMAGLVQYSFKFSMTTCPSPSKT